MLQTCATVKALVLCCASVSTVLYDVCKFVRVECKSSLKQLQVGIPCVSGCVSCLPLVFRGPVSRCFERYVATATFKFHRKKRVGYSRRTLKEGFLEALGCSGVRVFDGLLFSLPPFACCFACVLSNGGFPFSFSRWFLSHLEDRICGTSCRTLDVSNNTGTEVVNINK